MKKIYSLLLMALIAIGAQAQTGRFGTPVEFKDVPNKVPTKMAEGVNFKPTASKSLNLLKANAAPRKAITSVDQLVGTYLAASSVYDVDDDKKIVENEDFPVYAPAVTVTKIDSKTIGLKGLILNATEVIKATVDISAGTFSIADGQTLFTHEDYGDVILQNVSEENAPLTGTISSEGLLQFDGTYAWAAIIKSGQYAGAIWSGLYAETMFITPNGKMEYTNNDIAAYNNGPADVFVVVDEENYYAVIYNFGNQACPAIALLEDGNKFTFDDTPCIEGSTTTGDFYVAGVNGNSIIDLKGTGTDKKLTFATNWTFWTDNKYWYGEYSNSSVTITSGSTKFVYPNIADVEAVPADPEVLRYNAYEKLTDGKYGLLIMEIPSVDVENNPLKPSKLYYSIYTKKGTTESVVTFMKTQYSEISSMKMSEIPFEFLGSNFIGSGDLRGVKLNFDPNEYDYIGVQSIYKGAGVTNKTDIIWYDIASAGIAPVIQNGEVGNGAIYSIDGRRLNEVPAKGLYIQNGKKYIAK